MRVGIGDVDLALRRRGWRVGVRRSAEPAPVLHAPGPVVPRRRGWRASRSTAPRPGAAWLPSGACRGCAAPAAPPSRAALRAGAWPRATTRGDPPRSATAQVAHRRAPRRRARPRPRRRLGLLRGSRARAARNRRSRCGSRCPPASSRRRRSPRRSPTPLRAQRQHLAEQAGDRVLVTLDEPRDRRVIGPLLRRQDAERDILFARPLDLPRRPRPARAGVKQQRDRPSSPGHRPAGCGRPTGRRHRSHRGSSRQQHPGRTTRGGFLAATPGHPAASETTALDHTRRSAGPSPNGHNPDRA